METKFNIGDIIYYPVANTKQQWITCPDCMGKKYLTVILGDGTKVTIDCVTCSAGYEPPQGIIIKYEYTGEVKKSTVAGINAMGKKIEYLVDVNGDIEYGCYSCKRLTEVFATPEEAEVALKPLMEQHEEEERHRLASKEKPNRTWAWNATYHRNEIKRHQKDIEYHTAKMNAAKQYVKEAE